MSKSTEIHNEVVKMEFDNSKFESGVKQSMSTLERLRKALNFDKQTDSLRQLEKEANRVTFDDMAASLSKIEKRFSAFGIAGMTVMQDLTRSAESFARQFAAVITTPIKQAQNGGWSRAMNIKDAEFAMKGLNIVGKKLDKIKEDINFAVSGTAYGYDAAAKAASQFAASNVKIGDSMKTALRSVSGVAAQTNSSYEDISGIFTTVAANGRLMTEQLRQLSFRGLNATATLAKALGKTEAEVSDMVTKGKIDFETFARVMDDAFGEHATAANETFTGALNNMKAALSRIGANFADPLIDAERDVFNRTREILNSFNSVTKITKSGEKIRDEITKALSAEGDVNVDRIRELNRQLAKQTSYVTELGKSYIAERDSLKSLKNPTKEQIARTKELNGLIKEQTFMGSGAFERLANVFKGNLHNFRNTAIGILQDPAIMKAGNNLVDAISEIGAAFSRITKPISTAWRQIFPKKETDAILQATKRFKQFFKAIKLSRDASSNLESGFRGVFSVLSILRTVAGDVFNIFGKIGIPVANNLTKVFGFLGERLVDLEYYFNLVRAGVIYTLDYFSGFSDLIGSIGATLKNFSKAFTPLGSIVGSVAKIIGTVLFSAIIGIIAALEKLASMASSGLNFIQPMLSGFVSLLAAVANGVIVLVQSIQNGTVSVVKLLSGPLSNAVNMLGGGFKAAADGVSTFVNGFSKTKQELTNGGKAIDDTKEKTSGFLDTVKEFLESLKESDGFRMMTDGINSVADAIVNFTSKITLARVLAIAFIAVVGLVTHTVLSLLDAMNGLVRGGTGVLTSIKGLIDAITHKIAPVKKASTQFKEFAEGIIIIAGALAILSKIPVDDLKKSLITVGIAMASIGAFVAFVGVVSKAVGGSNLAGFNSVINSVMKMSIAIGLLSLAVAAIAKAKIDVSVDTFGKIGMVLLSFAALMGIMTVVGNYAKREGKVNAFAIIAYAGALYTVVKAFERLNGISIGDMWKTFAGLIPVIVTLGALSLAMSKIKFSSAAGLLLAVGTLYLAMPLINKLTKLDFKPIFKTLEDYKGVILILSGLGILLAILGKNIAEGFANFGKGLALISGSLLVLTGLVNILGSMNKGTLTKGLASLGMLLVLVAGLELFSKFTVGNDMGKFGLGLLAVSGALVVMTGIVAVLGMMDVATIKKGTLAIMALTACIVAIEIASGFTSGISNGAWKSVLATVLEILAVAGALYILASVPWDNLKGAAIALSGTMIALSAVMFALSAISKSSSHYKLAGFLTTLEALGMIMAMSAALTAIAKQPWQSIAAAGASMTAALFAVMFAINAISDVNTVSVGGLLATLAVIGVIAAMGAALYFVAQQPWQSIAATGASIVGAIAVIGLVVTALGSIPVTAGITAALNVVGFIGTLAALLAALDVISTQLGGNGLSSVGDLFGGLGEIIGKFISGLGSGLTSQLPKMGQDLGDFATNAKSFFDTMSNIGADSIKAIPEVMNALLQLKGAEVLGDVDSVFDFFTGQASDTFATDLVNFGEALKGFQDSITGINTEEVANAAKAGKLIAEMAMTLPNSGGLAGIFAGENDIDVFGSKLPKLAEGLSLFCENTKGLTTDGAQKAKIAMDMINAFSAEVPNTGGLAGILSGNNDIDVFGSKLPKLAEGLSSFCKNTEGLTTDGAKAAKAAMDIIIAFSREVPNSGGLFGMLAGNNDIDVFGSKLPKLAEGLSDFSQKIGNAKINIGQIENVSKSILRLADSAKAVQGANANQLVMFTSDLYMALGSYKKAISRIESSTTSSKKIDTFVNTVKRLANLSKSIGAGVGKNIKSLANDLQDFNKVGLNSVSSETVEAFSKGMEEALASIRTKEDKFLAQGRVIVESFCKGIGEKESEVVSKFNSLLTAALNAITNTASTFYEKGKYFGMRFANGVGSSEAVNAARASATRLGNVAVKALDVAIADPAGISDKAFALGKAFSNGFTIGIQNSSKLSERVSKDLGEKSVNALDKAIDDPVSLFGPISNESLDLGKSLGRGFTAGISMFNAGAEKAAAALGMAGIKGLDTGKLAEAAGKVIGGDFVDGLKTALDSVHRKDKSAVEKFFNAMFPKDVAKNVGANSGAEMANALDDALKTGGKGGSGGSGGKGGSGSGKKGKKDKDKFRWTKKDVNETLKYLAQIYQQYKIKYDAFNSALLDNGKITIEYLASSIKDTMLANAMRYMGADTFKKLNKEVDEEYKKLLKKNEEFKKNGKVSPETETKLRNKAAKDVATRAIEEYTEEFKGFKKTLSGMTNKSVMKTIASVPSAVATYVKNYNKSFKKVKGVISSLSKQTGKNAKDAVATLGQKLYMESDDYKQAKKEVKSYGKQLDKIRNKAKKYQQIALDKNSSKKQKQNAKARLKELAQQEKSVEKSLKKVSKQIAKGPAKAVEAFRDNVKETVKDFMSLSNVNFSKVIDGFNRVERSTNLKEDASESFDMFNVSLQTTTEAAEEAADAMGLLNVSVDTGINLLERFSKISTVSVRRLMKNATSQIKAYEEFQNGIAELRRRGLDSKFVDELASQGTSSLNYIRGFLKMSSNEIAQYNSMVTQKTQFQAKATEEAMEKQVEKYEKWTSDITTLTGRLPEAMIKQLKDNGVDGADFVSSLVNMNDATLAKVASMYTKSTSQAITNGVTTGVETGHKSFLEGVRALSAQYDKWNSDLATLATRGLSDAVIKKMRELGIDQTKDYVESMLKETSAGLQEINEYYTKNLNNGRSEGQVWIDNLTTSNKTYKQWTKNMKEIAGDLGKNNVLYKALQDMGWEAGAEYAHAFVNASESEKEEILEAFNKQQEFNEDAIMASLNQRINSIKQWNNDLKTLAGRDGMTDAFMKELIEMGPEAYEQVRALTEMSSEEFKRFASEYSNAITTVPETISNDVTATYARVAADAINSFSDNITSEETVEKGKKSVSDLLDKVGDKAKKKSKKHGKETGSVGLKELKKYVSEKEWKKISELGITGLVKGVIGGKQSVIKIVGDLAKSMNKELKDKLKVKSPSRVWMEIGEYTGQGLVIGLASYQDRVAKIAGDIGDTAITTMTNATKTVNDAFNGNFNEITPTITPTLDTSGLYREMLSVNAMLDSIGDVNINLNREGNKDVVKAINSMEERFNADIGELSRSMSQLQVVMDSGTLVGELAGPIDSALYQRTAYRQRGM